MNLRPPVSQPVELIAFDLGGVLVRVVQDWKEACRRAGVAIKPENEDAVRMARLRDANRQAEIGAIDAAAFARRCAEATGLDLGQIERILTAWLHGPYPGAGALLEQLTRRRVRTACLSNTNEHHWRILTAAGGFGELDLAQFDHRFASHLIGRAKPDPAAFEHVELTTGVPSERILFFDDLEQNCRAAAARGWNAERIAPGRDPIEQICAHLTHSSQS